MIYKSGLEKNIISLIQEDIKLRGSKAIFNEAFWNWKYKNNNVDFYPNWIILAKSKKEDKIVGHYTVIPVKFMANGNKILAAQSVDTLTQLNYRGHGIFTVLAKRCYNQLAIDEVDLIFGYPNDSSHPGFIRKLNWLDLFEVKELAYPLNHKKVVKLKFSNPLMRIFGNLYLYNKYSFLNFTRGKYKKYSFKIQDLKEFKIDIKIIREWLNKKYKYYVDRIIEYLTWRYLKNPIDKNVIIKSFHKGEELKGFYALKIKSYPHKSGLIIGHIMELLSDVEDEITIQYMLNDIVKSSNERKVDILHIYTHKEQHDYNILKKFGFMKFDKKHFIIRINKNVDKYQGIKSARNWYISLGDSDRA